MEVQSDLWCTFVFPEIGSLRGSFCTVKATAIQWNAKQKAEQNAVLAGIQRGKDKNAPVGMI